MSTSEPKAGERVKDVHFSEDTISVDWRMDVQLPPLLRCTRGSCMLLSTKGAIGVLPAGATAFIGLILMRI